MDFVETDASMMQLSSSTPILHAQDVYCFIDVQYGIMLINVHPKINVHPGIVFASAPDNPPV